MRTLLITSWLAALFVFAANVAFSQSIRLHGSLLFAADEIVHAGINPKDPGSANVVKGGLNQSLGLEYRHKRNASYELLYIGQNTKVNDFHYLENNNTVTTNLDANFQHFMLSGLGLMSKFGKPSPYIGPMVGIGFSSLRNPINGIQNRKGSFAWGIRTGVELGRTSLIKTRLFANALWTMKGIGGNYTNTTATNTQQTRYHTMIQFQTGVSLSLRVKNMTKKRESLKINKPSIASIPAKKPVITNNIRRNVLVKEIMLTGDTLTLSLSDDALVDNDTITLTVNDQVYMKRMMLRLEPKIFKFPIKDLDDTTDFIMFAENLGTIPPNTALLKVRFGESEQFVQMESTDSSSAMIRFINPKGKPRIPSRAVVDTPQIQTDLAKLQIQDSINRAKKLMAVMEVHAGEIRNSIPSATVTQKDVDINILFSTGLMFPKNSFIISDSYKRDLATLYSMYKKFPKSKVVIEGYTDDSGSDLYNLALSRSRAEIVFDYLVSLGLHPSVMETIGFGKKFPKFPNDTEENRKKNRRVEITIKPLQ